MLRSIGAVIGGYVVMFVLVFVTFSGLYLAIGADGAFEPGTYDVSMMWIVTSIVLSILAALAGGYVCESISRGGKAAVGLAILVAVLGLVAAIPPLTAPPSNEARTADVPNMEAMMKAKAPAWAALLNPFIGAAGALAGAKLRRGRG